MTTVRRRVGSIGLVGIACAGLVYLFASRERGALPELAVPADRHGGRVESAQASTTLVAEAGRAQRRSAGPDVALSEPVVPIPEVLVAEPAPEERLLLRGIVVDEAGEPIEGARVDALRTGGGDTARAVTVGDGSFQIDVADRIPLSVRVEAEGFAPAWIGPVFGGQSVTVVLLEPGRLTVVVSTPEGEPLPGATVLAWCEAESGISIWRREQRTDARGEALLEGVPRASVSVSARSEPRSESRRTVELEGQRELRLELVLGPGLVLRGRVTRAADGSPLAGARVGCRGLGFAQTGPEGRYELTGIPATTSSWGVGAVSGGYAPSFRYVRVDESTAGVELDFQLEPGVAARGRIVDRNGSAVSGARILASGRLVTAAFTGEILRAEAVAGWDGGFLLDPLHPSSRWTLRLLGPRGGVADVPIGPFEETGEVDLGDLVLDEAAGILGRVEGNVDLGSDAFCVALRPRSRSSSAGWSELSGETRVDPWGGFRFESVAPTEYLVELHAGRTPSSASALAVREVDLAPGSLEEVVLIAGGGRIVGHVSDPAGRSLRTIELVALAEDGRVVARGQPARDGSFVLTVPTLGEHVLSIHDRALQFEDERVEGVLPGGPEITVELRSCSGGSRLEGFVQLSSGSPVGDSIVSFRRADTLELFPRVAFSDERGYFMMEGLEDATYLVEILDHAGQFLPQDPPLAVPGQSAVEVVLQPRE